MGPTYGASVGFYAWAGTTDEIEVAGYVGGVSSPPPDQSYGSHKQPPESHIDVYGFDPTRTPGSFSRRSTSLKNGSTDEHATIPHESAYPTPSCEVPMPDLARSPARREADDPTCLIQNHQAGCRVLPDSP